eukprot:g3494.t1
MSSGKSNNSERVVTARSDFAKSTKSLKAVRDSRMQLQKETELLQNRLRVLKLEEERARKRIMIARRKAVTILKLRKEQDMDIEKRIEEKSKEKRKRKMLKKKLRLNREMVKAQIMLNKERDIESKMESVRRLKKERAQNRKDIQTFKHKVLKHAIRNSNSIKRQRELRRAKLEEAKADAILRAKEEYDRRLKTLEQEERELMDRLTRQTRIDVE